MPARFDRGLLPPSPDLSHELILWQAGINYVAGIDEAGRGAMAGPVAAAAVIFPADREIGLRLVGVNDSKKLTPAKRQCWADRLPALALAYGVGFASNQEIDQIGILQATRLAVSRALEKMSILPQHLLIDYLDLPECALPQTPLVKGDARSLSIAAASILAKTGRDACLLQLDAQYPGFGFARHKGYGTNAHRLAIKCLGLSPVHRRSFKFHSLIE
jgi:ribonuclease HII